ncbi:sporulation and spore germination protein [Kribbella rubisoli]|uniref:Sporulation and spore germination protein n=1 Tax=Kribbella rubisoli TaxID=3075929 RepID=A0A4Q7WYT0_9ACTN|nr:LpqB family beta-propeller domain-containing protein [Kribbella rubisoli]RZU15721.1 sporulation and spore germination protein [Kribbella rubisoli]
MRRRLLVVLLAAVVLLAGCAAVPTKGTIRSGERQGRAQDLGGVGVEAKPPRANVGAMAIVSGFLEAMSDSQAFDVARQYMTPEAAAKWQPEAQTVVYDQSPESLTRVGDDVQLSALKIATIGERGEWIPAAATDRADFLFKLKKIDGQLRVDSVPPGAYLGSNQVDLKLAPRDLYFFNPSLKILVPDPVYLPQNLSPGQGATQLIQELLKGPTSRLGNGVVTLAPPGTEVQVSVPVDLGVATVALNDAAGALRDPDRRMLAAQIVWTLNQLNLRAKITVGGAPLLPDDPDVLPFANFNQYDPQVSAGSQTKLYGLQHQKVQRIVGLDGASEIAAQPLNSSPLWAHKAQSFAVSLRGEAGAIVTAAGNEVLYGPLDTTDKDADSVAITVEGKTLQPSFDNQDSLWILDRATNPHPRLRVRDHDGHLTSVAVDFKGDTPLDLRMAPDGVRVLLVMKPKSGGQNYVQTGTIQTTGSGKQLVLAQLRQLRLALNNITDAAWNKQGIVVIGASNQTTNSARQAWLVNTDGSSLQLLPGSTPDFRPQYVASNPNKDTLPVIEDDAGRIHWLSRDLVWISPDSVGGGAAAITPTYPG